MNGISELLEKYGTSLAETRKLMPRLAEELKRPPKPPPAPQLPTVPWEIGVPQFFTAEEARQLGVELEPGWQLKVVPHKDPAPPAYSLITPEEWEITEGQMYISPEGQRFTREQLETQLAAPEIPLEVEQVFGKVFPEREVTEMLAYAEAQPEAFLADIFEIGRTPETEELLRTTFQATPEQLEEFFAPVAEPVPWETPVAITPEGQRVEMPWWQEAWNSFYFGLRRGIQELGRYTFRVLLPKMFPDVKEGQSKVTGMSDKRARELGYAYTAEEATITNEFLEPSRAKFRETAVKLETDWEDWLKKNPHLQPKPEYQQDVFYNPELLKDPGWWLHTMSSVTGTMIPAMSAGLAVTFTTKNPILGALTMAAAFTPLESMELYDDLIEHGCPEDRAEELALQIGAAIGAVEIVPGLILMKAVYPVFKPFRRGLQREVVKGVMRHMIAKGITTFTAIEVSEALEEVLQTVIRDFTVSFWDENRDIISGLPGVFIQALVGMIPTAIFGGGMSMRHVSPPEAAAVPQEQKTKEGWEQNPITGEWFEPARMTKIYEELIKQGKEAGLSEAQAKIQALNEIARTPEGEAAISEATKAKPRPPVPTVVPPEVPAVPLVVPPAVSKKIAKVHNTTGGASFDIKGKNLVGMDAFAVGVFTERAVFLPGEKITEADISDFVSKNADLFSQPQYVIGTWFDEGTGNSVLVVSLLRPNIESAMELARAEAQKEIFNLKTQERVPTEAELIISKFTEIDPIEFNAAVTKAPKQAFLTRYTLDELRSFRVFLSENKLVGYGIKPDGELVNLFNSSGVRGAGQEAIVQAIANGATKLDAMAVGFLQAYYEDAGFVVTERVKWDDQYAPKDWDYKKYGRPDIIYMEYPKGGTRNADNIRESFKSARARRIQLGLRRPGPPARIVPERGRPGRRGVPLAEQVPPERPVRVPPEAVAPEVAKPPVKPSVPPALPEVIPEVDVEVRRQLDELSKMADIWARKLADREQTKVSLSKFVRETLPLVARGRYIAAVARVTTDAQLQTQIARVQEFAERNAQKVLKAEIYKEIKKTQAKVKQHILTGKFTPETQRRLDTIRHNLELPRAQAEDRIVSNFDKYDKGDITWEEMNEDNEALNFAGMKEMTAKELMDTLDYIKVLKEVGRSERQAKRDAYRERMNVVRQDAVDTASGGKGSAKGIYSIPKSEWQATQSFLDKVINWMYNWDSILDKISKFRRDIPFKSPISVFGARVHRARHTQHLLSQEAQTNAIKGLEDIYKTKDRHQLNRILNSWKHEIVNLGEFELAVIEGEEVIVKTIRMTKGQMMTMYNLLKDPTLDTTFRNTLRWTDKIMDAVRNNLTAEEKAYADWAMDFFKNDPHIGYDAINAVYSDIYGVDLPNNPFYFPAFRDMESEIQEAVLTFREGRAYASVLNGSLKVRVRTIRALKFSDITDVISSHITKQAHFIAWGHTMRDMRAVFGNREVRETIEQYHGEHIMGEITKNLNDMARDGVERQQFGFIADYLRGNFTKAILGVKPSLLLKQIPSVFAYMTEMPMGDFVTGVSNYWQNPVENYKFMLQRSPYLRERFGVGFERDVHFANMKKPADFLSGHKPIKGYITENIRFGDKFAVMQGMWAAMLSELKGMGVTVKTATEEQKVKAMQFAEDVTNRTQPAFDIETLAPLQRGGPWVKLLTMFQTQPGQYFRIIGNNFRNFQYQRGTRTNAIKNIVLVWIILPCLWQLIADGFQWKPEHQYRAMILGQLNWILIVSQLSRSAYDWAVGEPFDYMASPVLASVRDFLFGIGKVRKVALQGKDPYVDISMDDVIGAVEFFGKSAGQVLGYPTPYLVQTERGLRHYLQELKEAGEDPEAIEVIKRFLFSEWALESPQQDVKDKAQEVSDKLGELIKEVDEVRIEYGVPGEYYGMKAAGSKFKSIFAHTLLSDITEENGFDKLAVAWAEMETARQTHADLLPGIPLWKINTDPMEGFTIIKLHQLWEARSRLTRLPEIVEFDKTWSDVHVEHGNVTRQQYSLLVKYLEAEDKDAFLEAHPELKVNPRNEWLKENPIDNARLALWGQAKILTLN